MQSLITFEKVGREEGGVKEFRWFTWHPHVASINIYFHPWKLSSKVFSFIFLRKEAEKLQKSSKSLLKKEWKINQLIRLVYKLFERSQAIVKMLQLISFIKRFPNFKITNVSYTKTFGWMFFLPIFNPFAVQFRIVMIYFLFVRELKK